MFSLPLSLQKALQELSQVGGLKALHPYMETVHEKYTRSGGEKRLEKEEALAYCLYRMPSTYAAIQYVLSKLSIRPKSLLDIGCGPGTAYFACKELFPQLEKAFCVDHNEHFLSLFRLLSYKAGVVLPELMHKRLQELILSDQTWDLGILSYVLTEMAEEEGVSLVERLLPSCSTLVLLEPGTPAGTQTILRVRQKAIEKGFHILAPCPHTEACPMVGKEWCHVRVRLERPTFQRKLKEGVLSYEDEPLSYLILQKNKPMSCGSRIVAHPQKRSGHVHLSLCQPDGSLKKIVVSRKDKTLYSQAKDSSWGDLF